MPSHVLLCFTKIKKRRHEATTRIVFHCDSAKMIRTDKEVRKDMRDPEDCITNEYCIYQILGGLEALFLCWTKWPIPTCTPSHLFGLLIPLLCTCYADLVPPPPFTDTAPGLHCVFPQRTEVHLGLEPLSKLPALVTVLRSSPRVVLGPHSLPFTVALCSHCNQSGYLQFHIDSWGLPHLHPAEE